MNLAHEIDLAVIPDTPLHGTRRTTRLPEKTITEEYRDLMEANRIPEGRRGSTASMVWDESDLQQADLEPCLLYTSDAADE